jgi:flagella synthesis protein FlgN
MLDDALLADHMRELLDQEAALLARLETLLAEETDALRGDDFAQLERVGAERHGCVGSLMSIDSERRSACRMLGLGEDGPQFEVLLDRCDRSGRLKQRWRTGLQVAARCKDRNERNGAVVAAKLRRVEALLLTVRGGQDRVAPVYGAGGLRPVGARGFELGCA